MTTKGKKDNVEEEKREAPEDSSTFFLRPAEKQKDKGKKKQKESSLLERLTFCYPRILCNEPSLGHSLTEFCKGLRIWVTGESGIFKSLKCLTFRARILPACSTFRYTYRVNQTDCETH